MVTWHEYSTYLKNEKLPNMPIETTSFEIRLDALVALKLEKYCFDAEGASGTLYGVQVQQQLQVSNCMSTPISLPLEEKEQEDPLLVIHTMRSFNYDDKAVGWYYSSLNGVWTKETIERQYRFVFLYCGHLAILLVGS